MRRRKADCGSRLPSGRGSPASSSCDGVSRGAGPHRSSCSPAVGTSSKRSPQRLELFLVPRELAGCEFIVGLSPMSSSDVGDLAAGVRLLRRTLRVRDRHRLKLG